MSFDPREQRPGGDRVEPVLALAKLDLRQISVLAAQPLLSGAERQAFTDEHAAAVDAAEGVLDRHGTRPDRGVGDLARMFFGFYYAYPNLGLVGPFFDDDTRPLREMTLISAYDAVITGTCVRAVFHARLWDHICDEDRRAAAARRYAVDRSLHSFPPSATAAAVRRYCRRIDTLMASAECVPALLATWAIEQHTPRFEDLATADLKTRHGLLELRDMARFMGMRPNTLSQSLRRFRARLGEEMRLLWNLEKTAVDDDEDGDR